MKKVLLIFMIFVVSYGHEIQDISNLVNDLIKNEDIPSVLSVISCWPHKSNFYFIKASTVPIQMSTEFKIQPRISDDKTNKLWYFIDLNCNGSYAFLNQIEVEYFAHPYRWIMYEPNEDLLINMTFLTDSNILYINFNAEKSQFNLKQVYKIDKESDFIHESFGHWSSESGLTDLRKTRILSRRRRDFRGKVLKSTLIVTKNESINELDNLLLSHVDFPAKHGYAMTNALASAVNASVIYNFVNTWGYGDMTHPEKLVGMMGHLLRNEIDIGGTVLFITADRVPYVEYLSETLLVKFAFFFRAPPLTYVSNIYYLPFQSMVWICSIVLVVVSTLITYITYRFSKEKDSTIISSDFLLYAIGTVCQMGTNLMPKGLSGKIATFAFCLSLIFIYTSYTANIVALLQSTSGKIRTLTDLLNSNLELGVDDTSYAHHYFATETEPIRKKIYETKVAPPNKPQNFVNVSYGVSKVRKGLYAFHTELATGYKSVKETFFEHEKCGIIEIEYLRATRPWHGIPKHSPYKEIFKIGLFKIREHGIQGVELSRRQTDRPSCNSQAQNFESVSIKDCYAAFLVLCYGIALALLLLLVERMSFVKCHFCRKTL